MFTDRTLVALQSHKHTHTHTHTHTHLQAHCSHEICDLVHQTQRHVRAGAFLFDCVRVCVCGCMCAYVCACIWQTGSPSTQTSTIGSLSRHIKVCFALCLVALLLLFVSLSVCVCVCVRTFLILWHQQLSSRKSTDAWKVKEWQGTKKSCYLHVATFSVFAGLFVLRSFTNLSNDSRVVFCCWTSLIPE